MANVPALPRLDYFILHGSIMQEGKKYERGQIVPLDYKTSRSLVAQKLVKLYDATTDKVVEVTEDSTRDRSGDRLPTIEEFTAAGYPADKYPAFVQAMKANPEDPSKAEPVAAAALLSNLWGLDAKSVEQANARRTYRVGAVTREGLSEQQSIADAFLAEKLLPGPIDATAVGIWTPKAQ